MTYFILNGKTPVPASVMEWGKWFEEETERRIVQKETIGEVQISTVFIGLDYSFSHGPPLLFETMIFGGEHNDYQERCSTWEQAEQMHATAVALIKSD